MLRDDRSTRISDFRVKVAKMRVLISIFLLMFIFTAQADSDLRVKFRSGDLGSSTDLGIVEVEGLGAVELTASRDGSQLTVTPGIPTAA